MYGKSVKHQPQRVGLSHELADEDISMSNLATAPGGWFYADHLTSHHHQTIKMQG